MTQNWITNNEGAAMLLRAADTMYAKAVAKSDSLPLSEKIVAIASARQIRDAAYEIARKADLK